MAYYKLEPFGPLREDLRAGTVAAIIANANRDPKKSSPYSADDFFPEYEEDEDDENDEGEYPEPVSIVSYRKRKTQHRSDGVRIQPWQEQLAQITAWQQQYDVLVSEQDQVKVEPRVDDPGRV